MLKEPTDDIRLVYLQLSILNHQVILLTIPSVALLYLVQLQIMLAYTWWNCLHSSLNFAKLAPKTNMICMQIGKLA